MMDFETMAIRSSFEGEDDIFNYFKLDSCQNTNDLEPNNMYWESLFHLESPLEKSKTHTEYTLKSPVFDFNLAPGFLDYLLGDNTIDHVNLGKSFNMEYTYNNETHPHQDSYQEVPRFVPLDLINNNNLSNIEKIKRSHEDKVLQYKTSPRRRNCGRISKQRPKGSKKVVEFKRSFNYDGIKTPTIVKDCEELQNVAKNEPPPNFNEMHKRKLIKAFSNAHNTVTAIKRKRYIRENLGQYLANQYNDIVYEENANFDITKPYEPQYIRYMIDLETNPPLPFNQTRSGLCPYCPDLHFYEIKTSAYAQHLALQHGVFTDNFLTPNPLFYGLYKLIKPDSPNKKKPKKTKAHELDREGIICPCCYEVIGVNCSKKTANFKPLTNYLRHFRDDHFYCKDKINPYKFFNKLEMRR